MAQSEMQDLLICRPKFLEKGPDIQTKLQISINQQDPPEITNERHTINQEQYSEMEEYFCQLDILEQLLKTNFKTGLSTLEAKDRQKMKPIDASNWSMFVKEINLFQIDLIIATMISITLAIYGYSQSPQLEFSGEEIITSCLLLIVITLTFAMGYQQRKKSAYAIKQDQEQIIIVLRDGKHEKILIEQLVPGDVCLLNEGLIIYQDMRILESKELEIQLNLDITQLIKGSQLFSGSIIQKGTGIGVVIKTGSSTTIALIQKRQGSRLLQKQLIYYQQVMTLLALLLILLVFIWSGLVWKKDDDALAYGFRVIEQIIIAIVPVGLLVTVTISFQMAIRRLAKLKYLVKDADSIERLSEINCICLGLNEVITQKTFTFNSFYDGRQLLYELNSENKLLNKCAILTCKRNKLDGTEKAIMDIFKQDQERIIKESKYYVKVIEQHLPFNSSKRYSLSIVEENNKYYVFVKGAPEVIWSYCTSTIFGIIDSTTQCQFNDSLFNQSQKGLRSIGFAYQVYDNDSQFYTNENDYEFNNQNFIYLGTLYLNNSLNELCIPIFDKFKEHNIKVVIITGEHPETARTMCKNTNHYENPLVIEGQQLYLHVDDQQEVTRLSSVENKLSNWCSNNEIIFARTSPEQKLSIVKTLQQLNYRVAVTGEGLTDLGAFKQAEISISKKHGSQQMIINSSDLVLTSSRQTFLDTYQAIIESRRAVNNVLKSIMLCLTSNTAMIFALLIYYCFGTPLPVSQNLMLLSSITVDLILGISLAREEFEYRIPKRICLILFSAIVLGGIEAGGGLMASLSAYKFYGFNFINLYETRFAKVIMPTDTDKYDPSNITLGNQNLGENCTYNDEAWSNFQWSSPQNYTYVDQRLLFVSCGDCTDEQMSTNPTYNGQCWNTKHSYPICQISTESQNEIENKSEKSPCHTAHASNYASTSFYIVLVLSQCINYFALRTLAKPYNQTRENSLAIYGLTISIILLPIIVYVPGIQSVFETASVPWELLGSAGLPFCIFLLITAETAKYLFRTYY